MNYMKKHVNIPWFVAHEGCGHSCVFCSQYKITGTDNRKFCTDDEKNRFFNTVEETLSTIEAEREAEIAFFGGSFTGIERSRMIMLLDWAYSFVKSGRVSGIRISTRPDYINDEILSILKAHGVSAIELGVQSMSDKVLTASKRGHNTSDSLRAAELIKHYGFSLGCQMMLGLPLSDEETEIDTAKKIVAMEADNTRIYPILVIEETKLDKMRAAGEYEPPKMDELISRGAKCLRVFLDGGVKVLRMGLQSGEGFDKSAEYEPAYGEYVWNKLYLDELEKELGRKDTNLENALIVVSVPKGDISKAVGQKRRNVDFLKQKYGVCNFKFIPNLSLKPGKLKIEQILPPKL